MDEQTRTNRRSSQRVIKVVYIVICTKCGEAFEVDTASRQVLCDDCIKKNEDITILKQMEEI